MLPALLRLLSLDVEGDNFWLGLDKRGLRWKRPLLLSSAGEEAARRGFFSLDFRSRSSLGYSYFGKPSFEF